MVAGRLIRTFKGHNLRVLRAAFSLDGRRIVTTSWDRTAKEWNTSTGSETHSLPKANERVAFSLDGRRIATGNRIWEVASPQQVATWEVAERTAQSRPATGPAQSE